MLRRHTCRHFNCLSVCLSVHLLLRFQTIFSKIGQYLIVYHISLFKGECMLIWRGAYYRNDRGTKLQCNFSYRPWVLDLVPLSSVPEGPSLQHGCHSPEHISNTQYHVSWFSLLTDLWVIKDKAYDPLRT